MTLASPNQAAYEKYFYKNKTRKAFIVGNSYGNSLNGHKDATQFANVLKREEFGFVKEYNYEDSQDIVLIKNTEDLLGEFKKFLDTINVVKETSIEFIFYFSGHGSVDKKKGLILYMENKKPLQLEKLIRLLEDKERDIAKVCKDKLNLVSLFRKLFILDCCRIKTPDKEQDAINEILSPQPNELSYPFKEHKNTAFLYSCNLGYPAITFLDPVFNNKFNNPHCLSLLTSSLIQRITSIRAPSRNLIETVSIIQRDILERYIAFKTCFDRANQKSIDKNLIINLSNIQIEDDGEVLNVIDSNQGDIDYVNNLLIRLKDGADNLPTPELLEKIIDDRFNLLYGDITVGKFVFVECEENDKDKEIERLKEQIEIQKKEIEGLYSSINKCNCII